LSPFNAPLSEPMQQVATELRDRGMSTFVRWNMIFCTPPLIIDDEQINEGLEILDRALSLADKFTTE
jgi:taurine--2-oxoglutarate transaminase